VSLLDAYRRSGDTACLPHGKRVLPRGDSWPWSVTLFLLRLTCSLPVPGRGPPRGEPPASMQTRRATSGTGYVPPAMSSRAGVRLGLAALRDYAGERVRTRPGGRPVTWNMPEMEQPRGGSGVERGGAARARGTRRFEACGGSLTAGAAPDPSGHRPVTEEGTPGPSVCDRSGPGDDPWRFGKVGDFLDAAPGPRVAPFLSRSSSERRRERVKLGEPSLNRPFRVVASAHGCGWRGVSASLSEGGTTETRCVTSAARRLWPSHPSVVVASSARTGAFQVDRQKGCPTGSA
jgi:hypothetical protein